MKKPPPASEGLSLSDRLLAAFLAPLFFNFSVFLVVFVFFRRGRGLARLLLVGPSIAATLLVMVLVPATAGFLAGTVKVANLMGHCFYTNSEAEKNSLFTIAIWLALIGFTYVLSRLF